jgi:enamine deaminase RidA (YjgF/YER057c/UK114 family)
MIGELLALEEATGNAIVQPKGWPRPKGYSNAIVARGRTVFIAGQIGCDKSGRLVSHDLVEQTRQALANVVEVLAAAGGRPEHIVRLNWFVTDRRRYKAEAKALGAVYRELIGRHYPAMTCLEVRALVEDEAQVELEATAVIPDD